MSIAAHTIAAALHTLQGAVITALLLNQRPVRADLIWDSFGKSDVITSYTISSLLPVFSFLSASNHTISIFQPNYANLSQWSEYALSAGLMDWLLCTLSGVVDIRSLISIVVINTLLQSVGYQLNQPGLSQVQKSQLLLHGFALHCAIWIHLFASFYHAIRSAENVVPGIVYGIIWVMFALNTSFGVWAALSINNSVGDQEQITTGYIILSLIAKSLLTWMVYFGLVRTDDTSSLEG